MSSHSLMCTAQTVSNVSRLCTNSSWQNYPKTLCFPPIDETFSLFVGTWSAINSLLGLMGNGLTLLAIPYASKRKKFKLDSQAATTVFILNLALTDFLYCGICLPITASVFLSRQWFLGPGMCFFTASFRFVNAFASWMSVALIAVSRCAIVVKPNLANQWFSACKGNLICIWVWLFAISLNAPIYTESIGRFGYSCRLGMCTLLPYDLENQTYLQFRALFYAGRYLIPSVLMLGSYVILWCHVWQTDRNLKSILTDTSVLKKSVLRREAKTSRALFLICFCYFIFVTPVAVANVFSINLDVETAQVLYCIYWLQYSINFFVYAARCEQYREAYLYFLTNVFTTTNK